MIKYSEQGAALLIFLISVSLATALLGQLTGDLSPSLYRAARQAKVSTELQKARTSLIAYTVTYADNYPASGAGVGHFPCPDRDPIGDGILTNDGPDPPCNRHGKNIGRMPRFTFSRDAGATRNSRKLIEFYPFRSLYDQQMWYVVSHEFINNPISTVVNPNTRGSLQVDDLQGVIAVIVAPGVELAQYGQRRPSNQISDYLEGENADGDTRFTRRATAAGNDLLAMITVDDVLPWMLRRVRGVLDEWFDHFSSELCEQDLYRCYPETLLDLLPVLDGQTSGSEQVERHWIVRNKWLDYVQYQVSAECHRPASGNCSMSWSADIEHPEYPLVLRVGAVGTRRQ